VAALNGQFLVRELDRLRVQGKSRPVAVYEIMAEAPGNKAQRDRANLYEQALVLYRNRDWDAADKALGQLLHTAPQDGAAASLRERVAAMRADPPPEGWDGVYAAKTK
jgi:adenylate cyclase